MPDWEDHLPAEHAWAVVMHTENPELVWLESELHVIWAPELTATPSGPLVPA